MEKEKIAKEEPKDLFGKAESPEDKKTPARRVRKVVPMRTLYCGCNTGISEDKSEGGVYFAAQNEPEADELKSRLPDGHVIYAPDMDFRSNRGGFNAFVINLKDIVGNPRARWMVNKTSWLGFRGSRLFMRDNSYIGFTPYESVRDFLSALFENFAPVSYTETEMIFANAGPVTKEVVGAVMDSLMPGNEIRRITTGPSTDRFRLIFELAQGVNSAIRRDYILAPLPETGDLNVFVSTVVTEADMEAASKENSKKIAAILKGTEPADTVETLLPLRVSHLPLVLPTGYLNGRIAGTNLVVNGAIDRMEQVDEVERENEETGEIQSVERRTNRFFARLTVFNLKTKEIVRIK